jgi:hypothetical protein
MPVWGDTLRIKLGGSFIIFLARKAEQYSIEGEF